MKRKGTENLRNCFEFLQKVFSRLDVSVCMYAFGDNSKQCLLTFDFAHAFYSHHKNTSFYVLRPKNIRFPYRGRTFSVPKTYVLHTENIKARGLKTDSIPFKS